MCGMKEAISKSSLRPRRKRSNGGGKEDGLDWKGKMAMNSFGGDGWLSLIVGIDFHVTFLNKV
jgi:hypothetical protein